MEAAECRAAALWEKAQNWEGKRGNHCHRVGKQKTAACASAGLGFFLCSTLMGKTCQSALIGAVCKLGASSQLCLIISLSRI